jgi:hypothetical protein
MGHQLKYTKYLFLISALSLLISWAWASSSIIPTILVILMLALWSIFDFTFALFLLAGIAICQGKVGIMFHTPAEVIIDDIYLLEIYFPIFLASFFLNHLNEARQQPVWHRYTTENLVLYIFFVFWALIGIFAADWKVRACIQITHMIIFFSYLTVLSSFTTEQLIVFVKLLALWGFVYFILAFMSISGLAFEFESIKLAKWLNLKLIFFEGKKRASLLSPPAVTAVFLGLCAWSAYLAGLLKQRRKYLYFVIAFLITIGIFYTRTRSEMVAFLFAGFAFVSILGWKKKYVVRGLTLCLIYVIFVWVMASGLDLSGALRRIKTATDVGERASLGIRLGLWKDGILKLGQTYGIGEGTGGFFKYKAQWPHAHNVYFSVLFDLGLIGFSLWIIIYLNLWRHVVYGIKLVPEKSDEWLILVVFLAFFVEISLTSLLQHEYTHFIWWLFPGLLLAATNNAFKRHDVKKPCIQ